MTRQPAERVRRSRTFYADVLATIAALAVSAAACRTRAPCDGIACAPACPRDAERDGTGRCACVQGTLPVLGACVPPAIADAYCGAAARATESGCVPRTCPSGEGVDVSTGACNAASGGVASLSACDDGGASVLSGGHPACIPSSATCPRGTVPAGAHESLCQRLTACPPGSMAENVGAGDAAAATCRAVVTAGRRDGLPRIDVGAWAAIALGSDGGPGSDDLCAPLFLRPDVFALPEDGPATLAIRIVVSSPDEDLTRVHARVQASLVSEAGDRPLSAEGASLVELSVATMLEPLRSLGGEASTAALELNVTCRPKSL